MGTLKCVGNMFAVAMLIVLGAAITLAYVTVFVAVPVGAVVLAAKFGLYLWRVL